MFLLQILLGTKTYQLDLEIIFNAHGHPRRHADKPSRIPLVPLNLNAVHERPSIGAAQHAVTRVQDWSRAREQLGYACSIFGIYEDRGRGKEHVCVMKSADRCRESSKCRINAFDFEYFLQYLITGVSASIKLLNRRYLQTRKRPLPSSTLTGKPRRFLLTPYHDRFL